MVDVPHSDTRSTGPCFQAMAQMAIDKIPAGPTLEALTAEKVFGWRNVHQHDDRDRFYGKRQDKAGCWRLAKVPPYSTNFLNAYSIEGRMEQLGWLDRYQKELAKITRSKNMPFEWASLKRGKFPGFSSWVSCLLTSLNDASIFILVLS